MNVSQVPLVPGSLPKKGRGLPTINFQVLLLLASRRVPFLTHIIFPSKIKQDLPNVPLGKVQELLDIQVFSGSIHWVLLEISSNLAVCKMRFNIASELRLAHPVAIGQKSLHCGGPCGVRGTQIFSKAAFGVKGKTHIIEKLRYVDIKKMSYIYFFDVVILEYEF